MSWARARRVGIPLLVIAGLAAALTSVWAGIDLESFDATPDGEVIRVTWVTASETNMLGFFIQRGLAQQGPFTRVSGLIWANGFPSSYEYVDSDVEVGPTYYYKLEVLEWSGE